MSQNDGQAPRHRLESSTLSFGMDVKTSEMTENNETTGSSASNDGTAVMQVQIVNRMGLHARPAMQFVDLSNKFASRITVCKNNHCVNAKSIMELLLLAAGMGTVLTIRAEGQDASQAVEALAKLVESKFGED